MRRRDFIIFLGGAAATRPRAARAQGSQPMRRVSLLLGLAENDPEAKNRVKAFRLGMRDSGVDRRAQRSLRISVCGQ